MELMLVISLLIGFFLTLFFTPIWIRRAREVNLTGKDVHKNSGEQVTEAGGVCVLFGFVLGILSYVALRTFYFQDMNQFIEIFSLLSVIMIVSFIGLIDDILGWKIGLNRKTRIFFLVFASVPLVVTNAGESAIFGMNIGLIYPLIFIPIGVAGATSVFNFVAGYNGLETSQGILILSGLSVVAWFTGNSWLSFITLIMVSCLVAFFIFNKYPARIFPGDILTYSVGALIAIIAILGNIEKIAVFFFIPYIIETGLKVRGNLKKESFAELNSDGSLEVPYKKFYGLEHIAVYVLKKIKKSHKAYEPEVVWMINGFQILIIILGLFLFRGTIF